MGAVGSPRDEELIVRDMDTSLRFYRDVLGLKVAYDQIIRTPRDAASDAAADRSLRLVLMQANDEAAAAAERAGYPLVMKASAGDILHKTGKGLIYLNLKSKDEAVASFRKIQEAAGRNVPVIAYRMVRGDREFVAGLVRAPLECYKKALIAFGRKHDVSK